MKTDAEMGTGAGSIEEGASPGASGGRMALLVCLASRAVGEYVSGLFFFLATKSVEVAVACAVGNTAVSIFYLRAGSHVTEFLPRKTFFQMQPEGSEHQPWCPLSGPSP